MGTHFGACLRTLFEEKTTSEEAFYAETDRFGVARDEAKAVFEGQEDADGRHVAAAMRALRPLEDAEVTRFVQAICADHGAEAEVA